MAMMDRIKLDGSRGEGGGQILRSALALSMVTGRPFAMERIRARRKKPGLMRQHLTAVKAASEICGSKLQGAVLGSQRLLFEPGPVRSGTYRFAVGSAGSATLVLQAVLPALLQTGKTSAITVEGGTHNPMAPPYDFLAKSFLPLLAKMGPSVSAKLNAHGFYPAGGGSFTVDIVGCTELQPLELIDGGEIQHRKARALVSQLSDQIGQRELSAVEARLGWSGDQLQLQRVDSRGPGNALMLTLVRQHVTEVFSAFGEIGVRAEKVSDKAVEQMRRHLGFGVPVGPHLADQLLVPLALSGGGAFRTHLPTRHTLTNIEVIKRFLEVEIAIEENGESEATIRIES